MKVLLASPSPRDLVEVRENMNTIPCDKLLIKYHHAKRAYKIIRSYFLDHKEYDYLAIHPDDLVVNKTHFDKLKENIEEHNFPVLSGVCNGDMKPPRDNILAVTITQLPHVNRHLRKYDFVPIEDHPEGIRRVLWAGFPFIWIRRDVLEKIELEDDSRFNNRNPRTANMGWAVDVMFCNSCYRLDIPIYSNFDVYMKHLRGDYEIPGSDFMTGVKEPKITLIQGEEEKDITAFCHNEYLTQEDWQKYPQENNWTHEVKYI